MTILVGRKRLNVTGPDDQKVSINPRFILTAGAGAVSSVDGLVGAVDLSTTYINLTEKGAANGVAELVGGTVPSSQLPGYVDDVLEFADLASFPATGESGKLYVTLDTNLTYRWTGTVYVEISASLALGETSATAYRGDRGKTAYDHSQDTTTNPHGVTAAQVGADATGSAAAAQAAAIQRANHTGTQPLSTISDAGGAASKNVGTTAGTVAAGDDSRLSDARTPTAHNHSASEITSGTVAQARLGTGSGGAGAKVLADNQTWITPSAGSSGGGALVPLGTAGGGTSYLSQSNVTTTDKVMALGTLYYVPVQVPRAMTLDRITFNNVAAYAGKTARLGIYTPATTGLPGSLLLDAGNVSMAAVAVLELTISQAVSAPMIWLAVGGPDVAFWVKAAAYVISSYNTTASNTTRIVGVQQSYTMGASLPATAAPTANTVDWTIDTRARIA